MPQKSNLSELRLLLEELCCDLCLFEHTAAGLSPREVGIQREFPLGPPGAFADIRVAAPGQAPYFVEVKFGYSQDRLIAHLARKYRAGGPAMSGVTRLVLVLDAKQAARWPETRAEAERALPSGLGIEVWNEGHLLEQIHRRFGVRVGSVTEGNLLDVREAIERAKGSIAFDGSVVEGYRIDPLAAELLWHYDFWRLRELRMARGGAVRNILPPGTYNDVAVVFADLCSFSSYVRDTTEPDLVRHCLTSFYSKARHQIVKQGGMLYQFVGDAVVGLFGLPDPTPGYVSHALEAARGLVSVGASVAHHWQRHIDHAQPDAGLRVGLALGGLQLVSLRPFSRTHVGVIGDAINIAARLQTASRPNEMVASNLLYNKLSVEEQRGFAEMRPVVARNLGTIKAWSSAGVPSSVEG